MGAYIVRRTLLALITIWAVSFLSWVILQLPPGDYADAYVAIMREWNIKPDWTPEEIDELRDEFGLNRPLLVQYWDWMYAAVVKGNFGQSYTEGKPITTVIREVLPITIGLSLFTMAITWVFAIPIGIYSAVRHNSIGDYVFTLLGFTGLAVPDFLLGLVLMYLFFLHFDMSVGGLYSGNYGDAPWGFAKVKDLLSHMVIPAIVIGTSGTAGLIRIMRNNLLDEIQKPYVVTARAKGMVGWKVIAKYPVRVALNPFISGIGAMLPSLIGGSIIISIVLSLPTIGPILMDSLKNEDPYSSGAIILILGALTVVGVLISDLLLVVMDPRIRLTDDS